MASDATVPNNFTTGAPSVADDVDANFNAILSWINTNAVHLDAAKAFTSVPSGPTGTDPTTDNQLTRKAYVDAKVPYTTLHRCSLRRSTGVSLPTATPTTITWLTAAFAGGFWTSGSTITVPSGADGLYSWGVTATTTLTASHTYRLFVNSVSAQTDTDSGAYEQRVGSTIALKAGDVLYLQVEQGSGGTGSISGLSFFLVKICD